MTKDHAYLYLSSLSEAKRQNEVALWRASHLENIACKQAIEEAIRRGFDGMHLSHDCARGVIEDFGFKRVGWVLAATIQLKPEDGRFSRRNKEWAAATFIPRSDRNYEFMVESHAGVLDIFVNEFRDAQDALGMFVRSHCDDMTGQELEGKVLVMSPFTLKESYWAPENQLWRPAASAAPPTPRAERYTPPASVTGSEPGGTGAISSAFSRKNICPTGQEKAWNRSGGKILPNLPA